MKEQDPEMSPCSASGVAIHILSTERVLETRTTLKTAKATMKPVLFFFFSCLVTQSCPSLCNPLDCNPPGSSALGIFQPRILQSVAIFLLQGLFPTQGSNLSLLCLLHCMQILYPLSHWGSPPRKTLASQTPPLVMAGQTQQCHMPSGQKGKRKGIFIHTPYPTI